MNWDNFQRFKRVIYSPMSRFDKMRFSCTVQNVGWIGHEHRNPKLFDKWCDLPNKAHRLFWRLHPGCRGNNHVK